MGGRMFVKTTSKLKLKSPYRKIFEDVFCEHENYEAKIMKLFFTFVFNYKGSISNTE